MIIVSGHMRVTFASISFIFAFIKRILTVMLLALATLIAIILALILWLLIVPRDSVCVDLPTLAAHVKISRWWGITDLGEYKTVIWTSNGSSGSFSQTDFSTNSRTSLYSTPRGDLVALGDGGFEIFIAFPKNEPPREIFQPPYSGPDSEAWTYLGAVDLNKQDKLEFFSPLRQRESYSMLGAGASPFRKSHQTN